MQNLLDDLKKLLAQDERLVSEKELLKNKTIELAIKLDPALIKLLLSDEKIKSVFFTEVAGVLIFDKDKFIRFITSKDFLPDSYTAFKNKVGLTENGEYISGKKEVVLSWPYKDCVLEGGQTKEAAQRDEVFWNQTLAPDEISRLLDPKVFTNVKRIDKTGEHKLDGFKVDNNGNIKDNLIIKGNNLLALHSLKSRFAGKVKLIYIDPPYNTGSDSFGYNDSFNHSTWLTFMKNRLEIAKELLRPDGIIFVQCDDSEQGYLKVLLDEIFKNLHQSTIYVQVRYPEKQLATAMKFHKLMETVFVYSKSEKPIFYQDKSDYDVSKYLWEIKELKKPSKIISLGGKKVEVFNNGDFIIKKQQKSSEKYLKEIWASGKILSSSSTGRFFRDHITGRYKDDGYGVLYKVHGIGSILGYRYITGPQKSGATKGKYYQEIPLGKKQENFIGDDKAISNFFDMAADFGNCRHEGGVELRSGKKPEVLLSKIIKMGSKVGDLFMDFHLGTGTSCAVAHKMGRQYIGIEQLNYGENDSVVRLKNVINGDQTGISKAVDWKDGSDFVYLEMAKWNENFAEKINKAKSAKELIKIWEEMKQKAFLSYKVDPKTIDKNVKYFTELSLIDQKRFLLESIDKNQMYINYSEIDDEDYAVSKDDKKLNKEFYKDKV